MVAKAAVALRKLASGRYAAFIVRPSLNDFNAVHQYALMSIALNPSGRAEADKVLGRIDTYAERTYGMVYQGEGYQRRVSPVSVDSPTRDDLKKEGQPAAKRNIGSFGLFGLFLVNVVVLSAVVAAILGRFWTAAGLIGIAAVVHIAFGTHKGNIFSGEERQ
jgi:hypothetical protein